MQQVCCKNRHTCKERPISELLTIITTPISGDNPFGENINYDSDFEIMKNEIAKLGGIDYELLESTGLKILKEKSKDIRVFSFLSFSFLKSENLEYFCDLFDGLGTLIEKDYEAIFPDRPRAKQNAFKWMAEERYTTTLADCKPTEEHYEHITRLVAGLTKIKQVLEDKFPEGSPFPSLIYSTAQRWEKSCKPKEKAPPPPPPPPPKENEGTPPQAAPAATAQSTPAASAAVEAEGLGPMDSPKQVQAIIRKAAQFLIVNESSKIMGYRLMRSVRWDGIGKKLINENGKTKLPAPIAQQRVFFQKLIEKADWKTIIIKGESAFCNGANHFWFDLQRYIVTACGELGSEYVELRKALLIEMALLVKRVPEIVNYTFIDGFPFCDEITKDWIVSEVQPALGSSSGSESNGGKSLGDALKEEQLEVNKLVAGGKVEDALTMIQKNMRSSSNERDNFRRTVMVGSLLLKAKQPSIAVSVLESLNLKIEQHCLDKWDPDIAVEAWANLVEAYKVTKNQKPQNVMTAIMEKQNSILSKISQLDPKKAFTLSK